MASIHKHPNSPFYSAFFYLPDGRRTSRSTGTSNRREALRIALEYENAAREARTGRFTEARARKTIADIFAIANQQELPKATTKDFLESWLRVKSMEAGERTGERYTSAINQFLKELGAKSRQDLLHLSSCDITAVRDALAARLSVNTGNFTIKVLRSALNDAVRQKLIEFNEASRVKLLRTRGKRHERKPFTREQVEMLLKHATNEWKGMILVGLYTGLRLGDIARLSWEQLDLKNGILTVSTEKTGKTVVIPFAPILLNYFKGLPGQRTAGPVFPGADSVRKRNRYGGALSNQFYDLLVSVGYAEERKHKSKGKGRNSARQFNPLSFHSLRHTATSWLKNAGVSDSIARDIIGHDSAAISAQYTHIDLNTKRQALAKLPSVQVSLEF